MKAAYFLSVLAFLVTACAHSVITPFSEPPHGGYPPSEPANVGIFRTQRPDVAIKEIGLISYQTTSLDLPRIYDLIRRDAAGYGADDVIDVNLRADQRLENRWVNECIPVTRCSSTGTCTTENVCQDHYIVVNVTNFLIEGSMIRKTP